MMYHNVLQVFHDVLLCFASSATIGITASATVQLPIAWGIGNNGAGIGDDSEEIGNDAAGIVGIAMNVIPC